MDTPDTLEAAFAQHLADPPDDAPVLRGDGAGDRVGDEGRNLMAKYPEECPVFELTCRVLAFGWAEGELLECVGISDGEAYLHARCVAQGEMGGLFRSAQPYFVLAGEVRPLTRAAREMLKLVRE